MFNELNFLKKEKLKKNSKWLKCLCVFFLVFKFFLKIKTFSYQIARFLYGVLACSQKMKDD